MELLVRCCEKYFMRSYYDHQLFSPEFVSLSMAVIRTYCPKICLVFISMIATLFIVSYAGVDNQYDIAYIMIDLEEKSESGQDKKEESRPKEYNYHQHHRLIFTSYSISDYSKYNQLTSSHFMDVFLEVLTPPPEA